MSSTVTSSKPRYVLFIDGVKSSGTPWGQAGAFPVRDIEFPDVGSKVSLSNDSTHIAPDYPLFTTFDLRNLDSEVAASLVQELDDQLMQLRMKNSPKKYTLARIVNQDTDGTHDVTKYENDQMIELDSASVHLVAGSRGTYQIQADAAQYGVGKDAGVKIAIDYKNRV